MTRPTLTEALDVVRAAVDLMATIAGEDEAKAFLQAVADRSTPLPVFSTERVTYPKDQPFPPFGSFQEQADQWILAALGVEVRNDPAQRNHRFLEEALELAQALGCTRDEVSVLADYVFGRPAGEPFQEVGGVMNTLALLCTAIGIDMTVAGNANLKECWFKIDRIRAKQATKPKNSPLPGVA